MRQLLATGKSDIPVEDIYTDASQVINVQFYASSLIFFLPFFLIVFFFFFFFFLVLDGADSGAAGALLQVATGDKPITDGSLLDFMRQVSCLKLDIRQESDRHTDAIDCSN
jgi:phosphoenolpyruvate carboxylase